tara:strand:- start:179 stop:1351 length:1173 start_codon:yes stop_codon:yes gene_type:complete
MAGQAPGGQKTPPNINSLAAQGIQGAGMGTAAGMAYKPSQVGVAGTSASINPNQVAGSNVNSALNNVTGSNITAQQVGQQTASPQVMAQQLLNANINAYQNPYTDQVIKANETDILRGANMGLDMLGAQAQAAGGFGGSRHGVAMGEMGRGVAQELAQSSAGLRQAGYQNAQAMAGQDIANNFQSQLANQQGGQFDVNANMQRELANQSAGLQASQANQQNALQSQGMNQQYGMQGQLANQGNALQAGLANQQAGMQGQMANQSAGLQDIQNQMQASLANQNAGLQGNQLNLGAANQLGQLSNLGFGMGQQVNNNLAQQGAQQQAMQQALMQAAQAQFQGFQNHGANGIGYVNQALGQTPNVGTVSTQETKQNGIFDYLTAMTNSYSGGA